ncbi:MAG: hypothetical protein WDW38_000337 [Sanguina aurantia]
MFAKHPWAQQTGLQGDAMGCICAPCTAGGNKKSSFGKKTGGLIQDANDLNSHACTAGHIAASQPVSNSLRSALGRAVDAGRQALRGVKMLMMMVAMRMTLAHMAARLFPVCIAMLRDSSVEGFHHRYNNPVYYSSALFCLSECLLQMLLAKVALSPYFSILADSSTDVSGEDHMLVFIRLGITKHDCKVVVATTAPQQQHSL